MERHAGEIEREFDAGNEKGAVKLHGMVLEVQKAVAGETIGDVKATSSSYMFGGLGKDGYYLLEFSPEGGRTWHHPAHFSAIGSADALAIHSFRELRHHHLSGLPIYHVQLLAQRTVQDAIATAAFGIGGVVKVATVDAGGARMLDGVEVKALEDGVKIWKDQEVELLVGLGPASAAPPPETSDPPTE